MTRRVKGPSQGSGVALDNEKFAHNIKTTTPKMHSSTTVRFMGDNPNDTCNVGMYRDMTNLGEITTTARWWTASSSEV